MKLIIVRHGETEENVKKICQGQRPGKLTKNGIEQTKKLALRLKDKKIDVVFSSDLKRAKDAAKEIIRLHNVPVHYIPELRERNFGIFEGRLIEKYKKSQKESGLSRAEFRPEGGESSIDIKKRVQEFLSKVFKEYKGKDVLIVSHAAVIRMLLGILLKKPIEEASYIKQANACVNIIEIGEDSEHKAHLINCIKHL